MNMLRRYTPAARHAMARAALLSLDAGRRTLDEDVILLALAETRPFEHPLDAFSLSPDAIRPEILSPTDHDLLATLGIDLTRVRHRMSTVIPLDDPTRWHLHRSPTRPLRLTLSGPPGDLPLTPRARKVIEVAANHHHTPQITGEDLLRGLLADGSNHAVTLLHHHGIPLRPLATALNFLSKAA
ncbi:hypothetical protein [Sphaerisporangium aureirubrum]|uniref:Clp R domain-containing protein n=1 Tax=Sphaerisporangium aureirubrum TaxID=1544736 RepID=A0ABW1NT49_9ACTN